MPTTTSTPLPAWLITTLRWLITLLLPVFLVLFSVRLAITETYLKLEYNRPGFPADPYGMTQDERLEYGPYGIRYMLNDADISYLGDLEIDGGPAFRDKELEHMEDVKVVTSAAMRVLAVLSLTLGAAVFALGWQRSTRRELRLALSGGGVFTLGLMLTLIFSALMAWDFFFDGFHALFFEGNSWRFYTHDTLIRLYPERFWFDTAMVIGVLTFTGALSAILGAWFWERHSVRQIQTQNNGAAPDPVEDISEVHPSSGPSDN